MPIILMQFFGIYRSYSAACTRQGLEAARLICEAHPDFRVSNLTTRPID